jgi:hypothetical protein
MTGDEELVEQPYLVPTHLKVNQTIGPFPARFLLPMIYSGFFLGIPLGVETWDATHGLLPPAVGAALLPPLAISPMAMWWLDPPAEHGILALSRFLGRSVFGARAPDRNENPIAVYRMPTSNLETASVDARRHARAQWGSILNGLEHPIKVVIRARPLTGLPVTDLLRDHPNQVGRDLGTWLERHLAGQKLIERDRLLIVPAIDEAELAFRTMALEKVMRQARLNAKRVPNDQVPLLRTLTWNPSATEVHDTPKTIEEGWTEAMTDGWWTRAYAWGRLPSTITTNWMSPLLAGDEALDVAYDIVPQDLPYVKRYVVEVKINQLESSRASSARELALEQLYALRRALERRRVAPFEMTCTVLVRGTSRQAVREQSQQIERRVVNMGGKLRPLLWEQVAGLMALDPTNTRPLGGRSHLIETGTLARTYPWSDSDLQLDNGVPWGTAGSRPCIFTTFAKGALGPHMAWYGTTNAGKGTGFHIYTSREHLIHGVRIFGIDQDEQHEHCGRFLDYLGGRKLTPRDVVDVRDIVLHKDDGVVILDLSATTEEEASDIFAAWATVVKQHMLTHPGRSILFVDEATRVVCSAAGEFAMRQAFERSRHWGQSSHAITQRPSSWFDSQVGRAIQGNCDAWWCGAQKPRELQEVADALELSAEEKRLVRGATIGTGLLVSGQRRVWHDLFDQLSPAEYAAFSTDPAINDTEPIPIRKEHTA